MGFTRALFPPADIAIGRVIFAPATILIGLGVIAYGATQLNPFSVISGCILLAAAWIPATDSLKRGWLRAKLLFLLYLITVIFAILVYGAGQVS